MLTDLEQEMLDLVHASELVGIPSRHKPEATFPADHWERLTALKFLVSLGLIDWDVDFRKMEYIFFKNGTISRCREERKDVLDAEIVLVNE